MGIGKLLAAMLTLGLMLPLTAQAQSHDCAYVHNATNRHINFRYGFGDSDRRRADLNAGTNYWICWTQGLLGGRRSEALLVMDIDMTSNQETHTYRLSLVPTESTNCNSVPTSNHYQISFEGNNLNRIQLTRGVPGTGSQPTIPPPTGQAPPYYPPATPAPYYPPATPAPYYPPGTAQPQPQPYPYPPASGAQPAPYYPPGAPAQPYYPPATPAPYYPPGTAQPQPYPPAPAPAPYYPPPAR